MHPWAPEWSDPAYRQPALEEDDAIALPENKPLGAQGRQPETGWMECEPTSLRILQLGRASAPFGIRALTYSARFQENSEQPSFIETPQIGANRLCFAHR